MTGTVKVKLHLSAIVLEERVHIERVHILAYNLVLIYYFDLQISGIKFGYESW